MGDKLWILSLDGGGIRSYSSLIILEKLLQDCWPGQNASDVFQVAYGTSGGGLCALMLGRLRMSITDAQNELQRVSRQVFTNGWTWLGRATGGWLWWPKYDINRLGHEIQQIGGTQAPMHTNPGCKTYVVTCKKRNGEADSVDTHLRTFNGLPNYEIWQAGLATGAAPTFFEAAIIDDQEYVDGGVVLNNPIKSFFADERRNVLEEARPAIQCYVSIGTGKPNARQTASARNYWRFWQQWNALQALQWLAKIALDTQKEHENFQLIAEGRQDVKYFRFNCEGSMSEIGLDETDKLDCIRQQTMLYINQGGYREECQRLQDFIAGRT